MAVWGPTDRSECAWEKDGDTEYTANPDPVWITSCKVSQVWQRNGVWIFTNVTVAQGATVSQADFKYIQYDGTRKDMHADFGCEDVDDAPDLTTLADVTGTRIPRITTAKTSVASDNQTSNAEYTVDITSAVQEVVNRSGWSSGNDLAVLAESVTGTSTQYKSCEVKNDTGNEPTLTITYTVGASGGFRTKLDGLASHKMQGLVQ